MRDRSTFALVVTAVSIGLAVVGNLLLRGTSWGLNLPLWILLTGACGYGLLRKSDVSVSRAAKWLALPVVVFSLCFFWHDSDALKVANGFALILAIGVLAQHAQKGNPTSGTVWDYTLKLALDWIQFTAQFAELIAKDIQWNRNAPSTARLTGVIRGLLLALPLLLIFGGLFASADAVFNASILNMLSFDATDLCLSIFVVLLLTILVGGMFRRICWPTKPPVLEPVQDEPTTKMPLGQTEMVVALCSLNILFVTFVAYQFRFLFGGHSQVVSAGLTYAQYARSGFFELTAVATLAIPVLVGAQALVPRGTTAFKRWFVFLGAVFTGCVFVILASALQRMNLYVEMYGLSELRVFTTLFMAWIAVTIGWLSLSFVLKKRSFSFGALEAGYAIVLLANCLNPDALIAQTNLEKAKTPDLAYLKELSVDAAPAIAANLGRVPSDQRAKLLSDLQGHWSNELAGQDWRSLNLSRLHYKAQGLKPKLMASIEKPR